MKKLITILIIISFISIPCFAGMQSADEAKATSTKTDSINPLEKIVAADNDFGLRIFSNLTNNAPQGNIFISPTSIEMALTMLYNGAAGKTKDAMAKTLGTNELTLEQANDANLSLRTQLKSSDPKVVLNIANSLWSQAGIKFNTNFLESNQKFYGADVTTLNFSDETSPQRINNWVNEKTNGKITKIVETLDPSMLIVLVNAIYFKGKWSIEFDKAKTEDLPFTLLDSTTKRVPMMTQSGHYSYFEDEKLQAISLPYGEGRMSMYVFLPKTTSSLNEFLSGLNEKTWTDLMSQFHYVKGDITLPRFKFEYSQTLNKALTELGMSNAFAGADFSNMTNSPAFISSVIHKTFVEVNEEGTEAAAVTSVIVATAIPNEPEPFSMIVDRPFFCTIRDNNTGAILFMGAITEPK